MTSDLTLASIRARYAAEVADAARRLGFDASAVERAFATVRREGYLPPPPWEIFAGSGFLHEKTSDPTTLYDDVLVVLDRRRGINNGQPSLHAAWLAAVAPRPGETIVQIGAGTGYYTAILAELVGADGRVEAYEIVPHLAEMARANLAAYATVRVHAVSGLGPVPPADVIYAAASLPAPPLAWLEALRPGGRLIFPWQPSGGGGRSLVIRREKGGFSATILFAVAFIGCTGAKRAGRRSRAPRPVIETRSLRLRRDREPDATATAVFDEAWLSSSEP